MIDADTIHVPKIFAETFDRKQEGNPEENNRLATFIERTSKLINNSLADLPGADWEIHGTNYRSLTINEPYGIFRDGRMTYVYSEQKGKKHPIAIFKSDTLAADYFVWLVSRGTRVINWNLFLETLK